MVQVAQTLSSRRALKTEGGSGAVVRPQIGPATSAFVVRDMGTDPHTVRR